MKKKDFYKFYKMLRGTDNNLQKITDYVFSCFDKDSNGVLDFSEFIIAYRLFRFNKGKSIDSLNYINFNFF